MCDRCCQKKVQYRDDITIPPIRGQYFDSKSKEHWFDVYTKVKARSNRQTKAYSELQSAYLNSLNNLEKSKVRYKKLQSAHDELRNTLLDRLDILEKKNLVDVWYQKAYYLSALINLVVLFIMFLEFMV